MQKTMLVLLCALAMADAENALVVELKKLARNKTNSNDLNSVLRNNARDSSVNANSLRGAKEDKKIEGRRIGGPASTDFTFDNLEKEFEHDLEAGENDITQVGEEVEKDITDLKREVKHVWEERDFQHAKRQSDVDVAEGVLLLVSIFIVMVMLQLYLGGWGCSGGKIQKGDEQQRKRAKSVTQFGAIIADNNELSCVYKKVSSSDNMHKAVDVSTPGAIVTAIVAQSADKECNEESSIELIEFSSLPTATSPQSLSTSNARRFQV